MAIMIAGTTSNAGKSVFTAALCRILSKMGYSVAPFKAQNMSLNSYVTKDGKEIAISQAFQAKAAGIEPDERMNPILLKPKGNFISQLIVMGEAVGDVFSEEYYSMIPELMRIVERAYRELEKDFDIVVIEGAGGIAEINLYDRDIANIGIARIAKPEIIILGDIERGGVFASLYGSYMLLPEDVRKLVKGFVINRLRGVSSILESGIRKLEELTGVKVLGVIPYVDVVFSEDSLCVEEWKSKNGKVGIVKLDKISNFTDFEPIREICTFLSPRDELNTDVLIIPGSKDTIRDLKILKIFNFEKKLKEFSRDKPVIGICGGYQMLGKEIIDRGVEHGNVRIKGFSLLDASTTFLEYKKTCKRVERVVTENACIIDRIKGEKVRGYEIHKGVTEAKGKRVFEDEGCVSEDSLCWGTYTHALFWNENVVKALAKFLDVKVRFRPFEDRIEKFANTVEECIELPINLTN